MIIYFVAGQSWVFLGGFFGKTDIWYVLLTFSESQSFFFFFTVLYFSVIYLYRMFLHSDLCVDAVMQKKLDLGYIFFQSSGQLLLYTQIICGKYSSSPELSGSVYVEGGSRPVYKQKQSINLLC